MIKTELLIYKPKNIQCIQIPVQAAPSLGAWKQLWSSVVTIFWFGFLLHLAGLLSLFGVSDKALSCSILHWDMARQCKDFRSVESYKPHFDSLFCLLQVCDLELISHHFSHLWNVGTPIWQHGTELYLRGPCKVCHRLGALPSVATVLCQGLSLPFENNPWLLSLPPYDMFFPCSLLCQALSFASPPAWSVNPGMTGVCSHFLQCTHACLGCLLTLGNILLLLG